jgi:hypothetical protein
MGLAKVAVSTPQTNLWLIQHWFSASTFVVKNLNLTPKKNP